jgi:hypothetical protein
MLTCKEVQEMLPARLGYRVMKSRLEAWLLAAALTAGGAGFTSAAAQPPAPVPGATRSWDCWISAGPVVSIRCIAAREGMEPPDPALGSGEAVLLDHIHNLIHSGKGIEIDGVVLANIEVFREGSIWNYPLESSWLEDRPARVVRAALCPPGTPCQVFVSRR